MPVLIRVNIGRDVDALGAGGLQAGEQLGRLSPLAFEGDFEMRNLYGQLRLSSNLNDFIQCIVEMDVLAADVAHVAAACGSSHFGQGDDFIAVGVKPFFVFQTGA